MFAASSMLYLIFKTDTFLQDNKVFDTAKDNLSDLNLVGFGIAGYLVGIGTKTGNNLKNFQKKIEIVLIKKGNGCTSGHGVCGMPRWSKRSWAAVCTFMTTSFAIATLRYYKPFLN